MLTIPGRDRQGERLRLDGRAALLGLHDSLIGVREVPGQEGAPRAGGERLFRADVGGLVLLEGFAQGGAGPGNAHLP